MNRCSKNNTCNYENIQKSGYLYKYLVCLFLITLAMFNLHQSMRDMALYSVRASIIDWVILLHHYLGESGESSILTTKQ